MKKIKVLLVQGGTSSEHAISLETGKMIKERLDEKKYRVDIVTINKEGSWSFGSGKALQIAQALKSISDRNYDVAFLALHGSFGEDGKIQALFESIRLPYTGSGIEASALAMNKSLSSLCFRSAGMTVPEFVEIKSVHNLSLLDQIAFPAVIKPCHGGSSFGVSMALKKTAVKRAVMKIIKNGDSAIVQKQIKGREFTCGVLEIGRGKTKILPPTEIVPIKSRFFDVKAKYTQGYSREITPPETPVAFIKKIQAEALKAHELLGCSGMSRSDFLFDGKKLFILETNTIPGMTPMSILPQEAKTAGISFQNMLDLIINSALRKP